MAVVRECIIHPILQISHFAVVVLIIFACITEAKLGEPDNHDRRLKKSKDKATAQYPLDQCQGDCDVDSHCRGNLICFHRQGSESVPGCYGGEKDRTSTDYCIDPKYVVADSSLFLPELKFLGRNPPETNFPLQECEGDCDRDSDCAAGLVCIQRHENDGPVPGCWGQDNSSADYCVRSSLLHKSERTKFTPSSPSNPSRSPGSTTALSQPEKTPEAIENFGLKMYWEPHYLWQEENFDRRWCMECWDGKCDYGDKTHIHTCERAYSQRYDFISVNKNDSMIRLHGTNLCFERISMDIFLYDCDVKNRRQLWVADFGRDKFEIKPFGLSSHCVTQRHHPKFYEEVEIEPCEMARSSHTSYWTRY